MTPRPIVQNFGSCASRPKGFSNSLWCCVPPALSRRNNARRSLRATSEHAVERVHQAVAERIGVDVEGRVDEMGHVGPEDLVAGPEPDGGPEAVALHRHPEFADALGRQFARAGAPRGACARNCRRRSAAPPCSACPRPWRRAGRSAPAGSGHAPAATGRSASRRTPKRSRPASGVSAPSGRPGGGQHLVDPMAEFVRQDHDVARPALVVHEDVRDGTTRHRRVREGAGRLAGPDGGIDPAVVEEPLGDAGQLRREAVRRRRAPCRAPRVQGTVRSGACGQGRIAVPVVQGVAPNQRAFSL